MVSFIITHRFRHHIPWLSSKEGPKKQHGQIEFVRTNCPAPYKSLIFNNLQTTRQKSRTNSICPCLKKARTSKIIYQYMTIHFFILSNTLCIYWKIRKKIALIPLRNRFFIVRSGISAILTQF